LLEIEEIRRIVEAALLASDEPIGIDRMQRMFGRGELDKEDPRGQLRAVLSAIEADCETRGYELSRVASGYRFQVPQELSPWISKLWEHKPPRYTRALLETLALIAYQQPVTRGDIEEVRGVSVSTNIIRTLVERGWIREVGHREVPGRPALYATTRSFLDYFNLKALSELPPLAEIKTLIEPIAGELDFGPDLQAETVDDGQDTGDDVPDEPMAAQSLGAEDDPAEPAPETNRPASEDSRGDSEDERPLATVVKLPVAE